MCVCAYLCVCVCVLLAEVIFFSTDAAETQLCILLYKVNSHVLMSFLL